VYQRLAATWAGRTRSRHALPDPIVSRRRSRRPAPARRCQAAFDMDDLMRVSDGGNVKRYGKRVPLTVQQQGLAVRYLPLARALARRIEKTCGAERDELESIAYVALVEAAQSFDPSYQVNFATYARFHIQGSLRDFRRQWFSARSARDQIRRVVFREGGRYVEDHGRVLGINPDSPVGTEIEAFDTIEEWLSRIPTVLAAACRLIYVHGLTHDEAARRLGCSKSYLSRLHRDAILWLSREKGDIAN